MTDKRTEYSAGIMSESSWFVELKKIINLLHDGIPIEDIKKKCISENLFGMDTELRVNRICGYLIRRAKTFDDAQVEIFCSSDLATQKLMNLISIIRGDRLFFEFINEVYREKCIIGFQFIETTDLNVFFRNKAIESETLSEWKDTTVGKVGRSYINFMCDANLLKKDGKKYLLTPPILDIALEHYLQDNGEVHILKAITGVQ